MSHTLVSTVTRNIQQLIERNLNPLQYLRSIDKALAVNTISLREYQQIQDNVRKLNRG